MRSLVITALCFFAFVVAGCAASSPTSTTSLTITPNGRLSAQIYVTFSGPLAAARRVRRAFDAPRKGDYMVVSTPIGQTQCDIVAGGGKVHISVVSAVGLNPSFSHTLCSSISGRF